jgi:hypothetical protein
VAGFFGLAVFAAFLLVRPFFDAAPAYRPRPPGTTYAYSFLMAAAFAPYALAAAASRAGLRTGWAVSGAAVLAGLLLPAALTQSQDVYAYLFYGKVWAVHGANPYTELPLRFASDPWFAYVRWPDQTTVYGPVWTMLTGGIAWLSGGSILLAFGLAKGLAGVLGAASLIGLVVAARDRGHDPGRTVLLFAWNPLVLVSVALGGHADVAVAAAVLWAVVADRRRRPMVATFLLVLATLVKAYAALALAVYLFALLRRGRGLFFRAAAVVAASVALAYLPFWAGSETFSGLARIAGRSSASLAGGIEALLAVGASDEVARLVVRVAGAAIIGAVILHTARSQGLPTDPWPGSVLVLAAYVVVTPWFLAWHLVGPLALGLVAATTSVRRGLLAFSGTSMLTLGGTNPWGRGIQTVVRYGVPVAAGAGSRTGEAGR